MLPLEKQITNLELSKRLHELGIEQDSLWYWAGTEIIHQEYCSHYENCISAFTAYELLELLPEEFYCYKYSLDGKVKWKCSKIMSFFTIEEDSCSNALAKMLIHLIEEKLIEV